jgi:hypothetical protein
MNPRNQPDIYSHDNLNTFAKTDDEAERLNPV